MKEHIETLKQLFTLDSILPYAVLCFCPSEDVMLLFDHVPIHLALGRVSYKLNKYACSKFQSFSHHEVNAWIMCDNCVQLSQWSWFYASQMWRCEEIGKMFLVVSSSKSWCRPVLCFDLNIFMLWLNLFVIRCYNK